MIVYSSSSLTSNDPDGGAFDLYAVNLATGAKMLLTGSVGGGFEGGFSSLVGWATDKKAIIFSDSSLTADDTDGGGSDLFAVNISTGAKELLTAPVAGGADGNSAPDGWSPNGKIALIEFHRVFDR